MNNQAVSRIPDRPLVSIVSPVYNEAAALPEFIRRIVAATAALEDRYRFEFLLVDDGSRDESLDVALQLASREPRLRVVELRRNYGQTSALQAGFDLADGAIIISLDADLQHFPEEIPLFLERIERGNDVVCGWRRERQEGIVRRWPSRVANALIRYASGLTIRDIGTTYRAYRREILRDVVLIGENHRFVPVFAKVAGAKIDELPIQNIDRPHGASNYGLFRTVNVFIDIFFIYFFVRYFDRPLRIFGKLALLSFGVAVLITVGLGVLWAQGGGAVVRERSGWFISALVLYLASLHFLVAGLIGEMLARLYFTSRDRSAYKVRTVWSGGASNEDPA